MPASWLRSNNVSLAIVSLGLLVCVSARPVLGQPAHQFPDYLEKEVGIAAGKFEEPCFTMAGTDRLDFTFDADSPVDFNLHYHQDEAVVLPLAMKNVREHSGTFVATQAHNYCLMWTNPGPAALKLRYRYQLFRAVAGQ